MGMKLGLISIGFMGLAACVPAGAPRVDRTASQISEEFGTPEPTPPPTDLVTLANERPVWEMRPVKAAAREITETIYTVGPGDTLRGIGEKTGAGSETIARVNALAAPYTIRPGQRLAIPAGRFHRVGEGETGIAIARAYGVGWAEIIALNALSEPYTLRVGQRLMLPAATPAGAVSAEARARAFRLDIDDIVKGGEPASETAVAGRAMAEPLSPTVAIAIPREFKGGFIWPAAGRLAARFGPAGRGQVNQGIDLAVARGAPILAAGDGTVAFVGNDVANYGGLILIRHGSGWITAYGRAAKARVVRGQAVKRGETIGQAGDGAAPLLFFQMRKNMTPVDPLGQLPRR